MTRAILATVLAVALVAGVSAQDRPNFAGIWRGADSSRWTITAEGSKMTVTRTVAGNSESNLYVFDGTPTKNVLGKGGQEVELIYTSKWDGNVLVTTIASTTSTRTERRSIEADGTMKIENTMVVQGKPLPSPPPMVLKKIE